MPTLPKNCNNPASRLYSALSQMGSPNVSHTGNGLREVLDCPSDPVKFFEMITEVYREFDSLKKAIELLDNDSPKKVMYLDNLFSLAEDLENFSISYNLGSRCGIKNENLVALCFMAADFKNEEDCEELLKILRKKITDLQNMVESSSIELKLKNWLLSLIRTMRDGIDRYKICGARAIDEEFTKIVGELVLNKSLREDLETNHKTVYDQFKDIVDILKTFKTFYSVCEPIAGEVALRLPHFLS
ncbi:hypothetical protein [Gimesia sp.]|uniref:hypothetical protein n=1 Tax=Gimesia sp. TaxID=2024833 RepID=UPI003A94B6DB